MQAVVVNAAINNDGSVPEQFGQFFIFGFRVEMGQSGRIEFLLQLRKIFIEFLLNSCDLTQMNAFAPAVADLHAIDKSSDRAEKRRADYVFIQAEKSEHLAPRLFADNVSLIDHVNTAGHCQHSARKRDLPRIGGDGLDGVADRI